MAGGHGRGSDRDGSESRRPSENGGRLLENLPVGVFRATDRGRVVAINDRIVEMVGGSSKQEVTDRPVSEFFADRPSRDEIVERLRADGRVVDEEGRITTLDGEELWVSMTITRTDQNGETYFDGIVRELSTDDDPHHALNFFRRLVEDAGVGFAVYDQSGAYTYVNREYARLLDTDRDRLVGTPIWNVVPAFDEDRFDDYWDSFAPGETRTTEAVHAFGDVSVPVETMTTRREIHGRTYHFGTVRDISERRERERELERENRRLEEFASHVSHDLRNPLTVAQGRVELAREGDPGEHLDHVAGALERMESLIDDVLDLTRHGQRVTQHEPVDLADLSRVCWSNVHVGAGELVVDVDLTVRADRGRLTRLLENLFRNAIDHAGPDPTVTVGSLDDGFFVADDGPGIPADGRDRIFEAGYTTEDEGTGFGLRIVREIADAHGWTVSIADDTEGACFEITGVTTGGDEAE